MRDANAGFRLYSEKEIRAAWGRTPGLRLLPDFLTAFLGELKGDVVLADTDTVTVRELREAWSRENLQTGLSASPAVTRHDLDRLLRDISEHREPEWTPGKIYRTYTGGRFLYKGGGIFICLGGDIDQAIIARPLTEEVP